MAIQEFNIDGIREQYPGCWLLVAVTDEDEQGEPIAGKLIAYSRSREAIVEAAKQHGAANPDVRRLVFFTGTQDAMGQDIETLIAEQSETPVNVAMEEQTEEDSSQPSVDIPEWQDVYSRFRN